MTLHKSTCLFAALLTICALVGACSHVGTAPNETPEPLRLYAMSCGHLDFSDLAPFSDESVYDGQQAEMVVSCFLIHHPRAGYLLWDVGLPDGLSDLPDGLIEEGYTATVPRTLVSQLAELNLTPEDIDYLAVSHPHTDHAGNANLFAGSQWLVDPAERDWMFSTEAVENGYVDPETVSELKDADWTPVAEDLDVFGDGTVTLIRTPGHTPGHLSLLVRLERAGPLLLTGDLYHLEQSREERRVPVFNTDREQTLASMDKFEALATEEGAQVIIQHVPANFDSLPTFPAYLD